MPLKVVTVSLGDIPRPRAAQNTHTSHSSECILGFHSLILRHMQMHKCIPSHECTHKNKMTDAEVPIKRKYSVWSSPIPTCSDGKKSLQVSGQDTELFNSLIILLKTTSLSGENYILSLLFSVAIEVWLQALLLESVKVDCRLAVGPNLTLM